MGKASRLKPRQIRKALQRLREKEEGRPGSQTASIALASMPTRPKQSPWDAALAADHMRMNGSWGEPEWHQEGHLTRQSFANGFARIAAERSEWAGLPVPMMGERLTIEKSYFMAEKQDDLNRLMNPETSLRTCHISEDADQTSLRNSFWSDRLRCRILIWQEGKKFGSALDHGNNRVDYDLRTLGCADAWSLETEERAMECLRGLLSHQQFRQYLLTGSFVETSKRSKVAYLFRRLRPTLAISTNGKNLRILAALCLHPIAYYNDSWAGAMCPSDDICSHLMLMRGDEKMFWKRANQHNPSRPEAGL